MGCHEYSEVLYAAVVFELASGSVSDSTQSALVWQMLHRKAVHILTMVSDF